MGLLGFWGKGNKSSTAMATTKQTKEETKKAKDPVCGMMVDEKKAAGKSEYQGKTYYFCSLGCKKVFDASPAKYAVGTPQQAASSHAHGHTM